ncbi:hypothetical protein CF328_g4301 [Tilletia controversa]|nr:hypothetical protein CF328_g4301 [Tilletia controversa]
MNPQGNEGNQHAPGVPNPGVAAAAAPNPAGLVLSEAQFQQLLARSGAPKDDAVEERVISKFKAGPAGAAPLVKSWHGSHILVSDDIISLFKAGVNIPLSLLTVAAIQDFRVNARRSAFHPKMVGKLLDEFNSWHSRDDFLPFPDWSQAINTLASLWRHFRPADRDEDPAEDPRVRKIVWSDRSREHGLSISLTKINAQILADSELSVAGKIGAASDFSNLGESDWWAIISASGSDILKMGKKVADAFSRALGSFRSPPTSPSKDRPTTSSSSTAQKRRREDEQPFRASGPPISVNISGIQPFRDPNRPRGPTKPTFCVICRHITLDHGWQGCNRPANASLQRVGHGWIWPGKPVALCAKFNSGNEELGSVSLWGHYCSQCGQQGHRAIEHGVVASAPPGFSVLGAAAGPSTGPSAGASASA